MSDEQTLVAVDSLVANEFEVEISGEKLMGIFRVSGLMTYNWTSEGMAYEPFQLVKMVQRDGNNTFNQWLRETMESAGGVARPTREVTVVAVDDGVETRRWKAVGARIQSVRYSEFDTGLSAMVEEIVTIEFESLEESWPAT